MPSPPNFKLGDKLATCKVYGIALDKLGNANDCVIALDGDTKNSTFSELFKKEHPNHFIECFIAEQNMVSISVGRATRNRTVPFCGMFAAFFTRAFDQICMAAISESNINLCGSHFRVSINEDGPSQMALEDFSMFWSIPNVFYPSDVATEKAIKLAANTKGICFIRTSRPDNAVIYNKNKNFQTGQAKVVLKSKDDQVTVTGAGVILMKKIKIRVLDLDPFTIKLLDKKLIIDNHHYEGSIGEAVAAVIVGELGITITVSVVSSILRSEKPAELQKMFGINKDAIVQAVKVALYMK
uniref:Transketolase-like pyrimidine-binding domain-containing protein n=1 Tax=Vombatus ursinus TaxID=29139 RepID=A0A4X2KCR9_VOMUR